MRVIDDRASRRDPGTFTRMTEPELAELDASLGRADGGWWNGFYQDRAKPCPFFVASPDESLAQWVREAIVRPGRAIDLGCGHGRNAVFLAQQGFAVEAVDYSQAAIDWARERVPQAGVAVSLMQRNVFELELGAGAYDLVYDSGCFHHIAPHRRAQYVKLVVNALKPGGWFGLTCFRPEGGSGLTDEEVYERGSLGGGLGYTEERLREIWSARLDVRVVRQMEKTAADSGLFGEPFLWVLLAQKP
jgi:SAM-dependent methyltransferase